MHFQVTLPDVLLDEGVMMSVVPFSTLSLNVTVIEPSEGLEPRSTLVTALPLIEAADGKPAETLEVGKCPFEA